MSARGTTNTNDRGNAASRRARKLWLLAKYGTGEYALCAIGFNDICQGVVDYETVTVNRVVPGVLGGRYVRDNIEPACAPCNIYDGNYLRERLRLERKCSR